VTLQEYEFPSNKVANISTQTNMLIEKNYYLNKSARDAYRSYLLSYASHSHKDIFNVHELDLQGASLFHDIPFYSIILHSSTLHYIKSKQL
jgi:ATP-dependent RNA helicase DDX18/HAS1